MLAFNNNKKSQLVYNNCFISGMWELQRACLYFIATNKESWTVLFCFKLQDQKSKEESGEGNREQLESRVSTRISVQLSQSAPLSTNLQMETYSIFSFSGSIP